MSLREKLEEALRRAGAPEEYLSGNEFRLVLEGCQDVLASPGLVCLEVGFFFREREVDDPYPTFLDRMRHFLGKVWPTVIERQPMTCLVPIIEEGFTEENFQNELHWYSINLLSIWSTDPAKVFIADKGEYPGLTTREIFDEETPKKATHLLTLTSRDLTRREYEEAKQRFLELRKQENPEEMEWMRNLPVPELAD